MHIVKKMALDIRSPIDGTQAEYVKVPFRRQLFIPCTESLPDEALVMLSTF